MNSRKIHMTSSPNSTAVITHHHGTISRTCYMQNKPFRFLHTLRPALGIELITEEGGVKLQKLTDADEEKKDKLRLVYDRRPRPPLVIFLLWLMSKPRHEAKFINYYLSNGFDVVVVRTTPYQLMLPCKGANLIADDFVSFLELNPEYDRLLVHGFSVGGYMWAATLIRLLELGQIRKNDPISPFDAVSNRVQGTIWDSVSDIEGHPVGVSRSILKPESMLCNALENYITFHLKVFYDIATKYYIRASQAFHSAQVRKPALILYSKADLISTTKTNISFYNAWTELGIQVYTKLWEDTPHVGHYAKYPYEYIEVLDNFLDKIGLISNLQEKELRMTISN